MTKKLSAKIGEYKKDGQTKGRYVNIGVIMQSNDGGEYVLLDPSASLAGILQQQNVLAIQQGKEVRDRIMCSVFEDQPQLGGYQQPQQSYQHHPHQGRQQAPQQPQQSGPYGGGVNDPNEPAF